MKKILLMLGLTAIVALMAVPAAAVTLSAEDLIGTVEPGQPANAADELGRLNQLITMYNTGVPGSPYSVTIGSFDYTFALISGSSVPVAPLPTAFGGFQVDEDDIATFHLTTSYLYLMAKFGQNDAFYWLGGQKGSPINLTFTGENPFGSKGTGLSHITLFNPTVVPEPATMLLLGLGLVGLTLIRRKG